MQTLSSLLLAPKFQSRCYGAAIALFLAIVVIGSLPGARDDIGQLASGGVLHSVAYAALGALLFVGSVGAKSQRGIKTVLTIAAMGAIDEYVQSFFPYRTAAVSDWLVDLAAGSVVSVVFGLLWPAD